MSLRTAVFFDIENLLKGYSFSQQLITNLSLAEILRSVRDQHEVGGLAVQRAYANWSDGRLAVMRGEINELGIDPVQVFGFSRDNKKNAADIQLAIDAIDLAHVRPAIETYVIVSGDGGFAALAKKLHEYGKRVIGCAYRNAANRVFRSVCDGFVWIEDPEVAADLDTPASALRSPSARAGLAAEVQDPRNQRIVEGLERLPAGATQAQILAKTRELLGRYARDVECATALTVTGIYPAVVREALVYAIPGFQQSRLGFPKFAEFLQHVCADTSLCLARPAGDHPRLYARSQLPPGVELLPDLRARPLHTLDNYRFELQLGQCSFRLPEPALLQRVAELLCSNGRQRESLGGWLDRLAAALPEAPSEGLKWALLSLVSAEAFVREPEQAPLSEQMLGLRPDLHDAAQLLAALRVAIETKLCSTLGECRAELLDELLGPA